MTEILLAALAGISIILVHRHRMAGRVNPEPGRVLRKGRFRELELEVLGPLPKPPVTPVVDVSAQTAEPGLERKTPHGTNEGGRSLNAAAALDGVVPALEYTWAWSRVDDHLFQAIEHMTHDSIQSVADLGRAIDAHHWAANSWTGPDAGLVASVKGHLAEWLAADHLMQAGHAVAMPVASNQAGWDLLADGHKINVKTVQDAASTLHAHFAAQPDIGVLLPHDAAHIPADALHFDPSHGADLAGVAHHGHMVVVDGALSHADAAHAAQGGLDVAAGHMHVHFPWITMAVSSFREGRLLFRGDTDLFRAAKNVGVAAAMVWGGVKLGAMAGAAIGTWIAPGVGSLVGLLGGVVGALGGRAAANAVKFQPLRETQTAYEGATSSYRALESQVTDKATNDWTRFQGEQKRWLEAEAGRTEEQARATVQQARDKLQDALTLDPKSASKLLDLTHRVLVQEEEDARKAYQSFSWGRRWIWPSEQTLAAKRLWKDRRRFLTDWCIERTLFERNHVSSAHMPTPGVFDLALCTEEGELPARTHLTRAGVARAEALAEAERVRGEAVGAVIKARRTTVERLQQRQQEIVRWVKEQMEPAARLLEQARGHFVGELRKAGVKVGA